MSTTMIGRVERAVYLSGLPGLEGLPREQLELIARCAKERYFRRGEVLFDRGTPVSGLFFIVDGGVHVFAGDGRTITRRGPRTTLGWLTLLGGLEPDFKAVAARSTLALHLDREALFKIYEDLSYGFPILLHSLGALGRMLVREIKCEPELLEAVADRRNRQPPGGQIDLVNKMFYLRELPLFGDANIDAVSEIARSLQEVHFEPGDTLWQAGDEPDAVFLPLQGEIVVTPQSQDAQEFRHRPVEPCGLIESLAEIRHWTTARAATEMVTLRGEREILLDVVEDNVEIGMEVLSVFARMIVKGYEDRTGSHLVEWDHHHHRGSNAVNADDAQRSAGAARQM